MRSLLLTNRPKGIRATGIIIRNKKILLMKLVTPEQTIYNLPGGGWDSGETLEQTLEREISEEFSCKIIVKRLVCICDSTDRLNFIFEAESNTNKIKLGGEEKERNSSKLSFEVCWLPLNQIQKINLQPSVLKSVLKRYNSNKHQQTFFTRESRKINNNILIVAPSKTTIPVSGYGGIERIVGQIYNLYKNDRYNVDIISKATSLYHTYAFEEIKNINFKKYRFIVSYNYEKEVLQELNKHNAVLHIIFQNNYKEKLKFIDNLYHINPYVLSLDQQIQYKNNLSLDFPIIPNGVDTRIFKIKSISERDKDIVYIGAIGQHKSPLACLLYAKKNDLAIDFYGPTIFSENEVEYANTFYEQAGKYPKCRLLGEVHGEQNKCRILNQYKYFIFLPSIDKKSWVEPFGIAPLEAMSCGCTVITQLDIGGHKSFCNKQNTIQLDQKPNQLDPQMVRKSVLNFDIKKIYSKFYPK